MWVQTEENAAAESDEESGLSSEDEGDIQCEILEKQRDEANQRLSELEEVSSQLLKEISVLEIQFQIERSCRESAEALAVTVSKENKVLKRKSQMLMPLIPELPEDVAAMAFDPEMDSKLNCDEVDVCKDVTEETLLLDSQAKIAELQASVDGLLAEKLQLEQRVEDLTKEQDQLREQLALELEEKEAILRRMNKQSKTMNKIKRVSQLVSEEFTEMSQKLELEQGLRAHAEVVAHQMLVQQEEEAHRQGVMLMQSSNTGLQLQQALEQISSISTTLTDIQRCYQDQIKQSHSTVEESSFNSELQELKKQLQRSEEGRTALETQLSEANSKATQLQEEVKKLQEKLDEKDKMEDPEAKSSPATPTPAPPPPPPPPAPPAPPPPPPPTNPLDFVKRRRKDGVCSANENKPVTVPDMKAKAVDEMMERIKKGIVLRPIKIKQEDDNSWKDQRSENRKSAILELKGMLDNIKHQPLRRLPSRRGMGRNVGEAELLQVLQRRRRAIGENRNSTILSQTQAESEQSNQAVAVKTTSDAPWPGPSDLQSSPKSVPAAAHVPWAEETGSAPVLRRLRQNREKRDSRIRGSALIINQEN